MTTDQTTAPVVSRFLLTAGVVPIAVTAIAVAIQLALLGDLPEVVAVNWDAAGQPNRFGPAWSVPLATAISGIVIIASILGANLRGLMRGNRGPTYRVMGALATGLTALVAVLATSTLGLQAGLADAQGAPAITAPLLISFVSAGAAGIGAWVVQPRQAAPRSGSASRRLDLRPTERAVWMRETGLSAPLTAITSAVLILMLALVPSAWLLGASTGTTIALAAAAAVVLLVSPMLLPYRVRVDHRGLSVTSVIGYPRFTVPASDVRTVETSQVDPIGEFGGWGLRWVPGRIGIITRSGEAVRVQRRSGRWLVVTVDDATTAAALLQTLSTREGAISA